MTDDKNDNLNRKRGKLFSSFLLGLVLILLGGIFIRGIKTESTVENRALTKFPVFSVVSFVNTDYQTGLEAALSDQLILGQTLKKAYNNIKNRSLSITVASLKYISSLSPKKEKTPHNSLATITFPDITPRGNDLFELDDSHHLVFPKYEGTEYQELFQSKANNVNRLADSYPNIDFYCFYIETDIDIDFIQQEINHSLVDDFGSRLNEQVFLGKLTINTPEEFQKWYFKTDHHWNSVGQREGYQQIIALLKGNQEKLLETEIIDFPAIAYNGYKSRKIDDYLISDTFDLLKGDLPENEVYINRQKARYGNKQAYEEGHYTSAQGFNHYASCYGNDLGMIEYRYNQPEKGNLIVFVDSFSNPINELIAAHFNKTYFIDLRHYENDSGKPFAFSDFINNKDIDKVLLMGYFYFFANDTFLING